MPTIQALELARKQNVDLVMVAPTAVPPVCRILDYGKYKYAQEKREREQKKGQKTQDIREIRLRPKIGIHDFEAKARIAKKMLLDGDKVRVVVMFRGREITHADLGAKLLEKMVDSLTGAAGIEKQPLLDGKRLTMVLIPLPGHKPEIKEKAEPKEKKEIKAKKETVEKVKEVQDAKA
jgi:translation initiation factor IF-3